MLVWVSPPGNSVIVQFPDGNPFKTTLPEGMVQVGCVIVPTEGIAGIIGAAFIVIDEVKEAHRLESLTEKA